MFGDYLGYYAGNIETVQLYKDMTARDLLQRSIINVKYGTNVKELQRIMGIQSGRILGLFEHVLKVVWQCWMVCIDCTEEQLQYCNV